MSIHLTKILSAVKEGQQKYCETVYSRSGINHMWILKNSKDLLDNLKSRSFSQVSSIKTFDFSTLYTTLPHDKLKTRLKETIHKAFSHRSYGSKFVVLGYNSTYFSNKIQKGKTCYSEEQVISMLEFLIDNIFVSFGGTLFQQVVGIPMGTNCAPLLADLFLYSYESEFLQKLVKRFMRLEPLISHTGTALAVDDRHVAFCEHNGSVARIVCVAVATLANEKLLECASDNDLLLCRKSTSNKTRYRQ